VLDGIALRRSVHRDDDLLALWSHIRHSGRREGRAGRGRAVGRTPSLVRVNSRRRKTRDVH